MFGLLCFVMAILASPFKPKMRLEAENAVLRHQLIVLRRRRRGRVRLTNNDRWLLIQLRGQRLPLRRLRRGGGRVAEQIELTCIAVRMAVSGRRAHGHLPDSRRESPMLRLNPAIAMVRPKPTSHPAAALPRRSAPQCQHREWRQHARPREPPDRTSRPESPAIARMPDQRGCNGKPLCQPSQPPHEYGPGIRPKDATDKEARTPRSRGRCVVVLYNQARTHLSVNKDAPSPRTVHSVGRILPTPFLGGLHHLYVRV